MDSSNEWHNESKEGALMINQYQKDTYDYDQAIKKVGREMIEGQDIEDEEKIKILQKEGININVEELEDLMTNEDYTKRQENYEAISMQEFLQNKSVNSNSPSKMSVEKQMFSQEVDFEMFHRKFWGKNKGNLKLSALNVWTEIYSVIKGGIDALQNTKYYYKEDIIDWETYEKMNSPLKDSLQDHEKRRVYTLYVKYEKWKKKHNYYDFMDVVRHVFKHMGYRRKCYIDYLVIDEVQDLSPLTIQLLLISTNENIFFCGDTAQTIAKGVASRFHDLKPVFVNQKYSYSRQLMDQKAERCEPKVLQLTRNYRSHNNILQLANSIVDIVELYFPQTIDKLQRESSEIDGPKPIVLQGFLPKDLEKLIMSSGKSSTPRFGCNQVVIVRNQEMKNHLPLFMKNALWLTVYETKGLEFDDVILYDFFTESTCPSQWRILNDIEVYSETRKKLKIQDHLTINELDFKEYNKLIQKLSNEEEKGDEAEYEEVSVLHSTKDREDVNRNFGMLNVELKHLYVSVTRPKKNLIIYDSQSQQKNPIFDYWASLDLIDIVEKGEEKEHPVLSKAFEVSEDIAESKEQWRALGIKLFKKKYYTSVIQCFEESGDEDLKMRTLGYMHAEEASSLQSEAGVLLYHSKHNNYLSKFEKRNKKKEGKNLKLKAAEEFRKAGEFFEKIKLYKNAAQ